MFQRLSSLIVPLQFGNSGVQDSQILLQQAVFSLRQVARQPPPPLSTLTLRVILRDLNSGPFHPRFNDSWTALDALLCEEFTELEKFLVEVQILDEIPALGTQAQHQAFVEQRLAATKAKGILYFLEDDLYEPRL